MNSKTRSKSVDISLERGRDYSRARISTRLSGLRQVRARSQSAVQAIHRQLFARRHHNTEDAPYCLPNDDEEVDRLDQQHYVLRALFGRNYLAPIQAPAYVLDIGAGTGTWQMEMAAEFPDSQFIGIDISPIQPTSCLPSNCQFEMVNMLEGLPYQNHRFDYVHQRMVSLGVPTDRWDMLLSEHARVCRPGGWLELLETDWAPCDGGPGAQQLTHYIRELCKARDCEPRETANLTSQIEEAGFGDVRRLRVQLPIGGWGGLIGTQARHVVLSAWEAMRGPMLEHGVATNEQLDETFALLEAELVEQPMWLCLVVYIGQRRAD
ncbi:S-adenosyl-L-methionine-dependent methyltransferase [Thamnocephalis sphaerospora]|uniref:S-adenosyl-L-methionine-dependent methyltransferase n=1 Tax=Thamnocephalis sphaerospora TaxID=78915 RepID=A0A4P9XT31_9FUNG|nr:S-adenosyl-L-methionine-dependent methyltransferase [Thamnocephalis sphaerospora]|eukprot:RKP09142.1 S-adenosyl-L-methionine-dependent methyltransferase [Thamnocephalis sphaerospora]